MELPLPETIEECHSIIKWLFRSRLYIDGQPFREGHWLYRDRTNDRLYLVTVALKPNLSVILSSPHKILVSGVTGAKDSVERPHSQGTEIITSIDNLGDFKSMAEAFQGKILNA